MVHRTRHLRSFVANWQPTRSVTPVTSFCARLRRTPVSNVCGLYRMATSGAGKQSSFATVSDQSNGKKSRSRSPGRWNATRVSHATTFACHSIERLQTNPNSVGWKINDLTLPVRENLDALGRSTIFWERLRAVALALRKAATDHLDRSIPDGALAEKRPYRSARRRVQRLQRLAAIPGFRIELQGDSRRDGGR
jgi:hypothetical protein